MPLIYRTTHFCVEAPDPPHVCRTDGGHLVIHPVEPVVHRWELDPERAKALMRLSMLVGEAMFTGLNERGIPIERLNFQDNGNWGIDTPQGPRFHLHLYGRARGSVHQVHGEALTFPAKATAFWKDYAPLDEGDCLAICRRIDRLLQQPRYACQRWGIADGQD